MNALQQKTNGRGDSAAQGKAKLFDWTMTPYSVFVGKGKNRHSVTRYMIHEENGTDEGILIAENVSLATAEKICAWNNAENN